MTDRAHVHVPWTSPTGKYDDGIAERPASLETPLPMLEYADVRTGPVITCCDCHRPCVRRGNAVRCYECSLERARARGREGWKA